jgi:UDP-N-acetylmuramate dehydrogenase
MHIQENFSLQKHNTFGIQAYAKFFLEVTSVKQLQEILTKKQTEKLFVLGGGSNMLLTQNVDALVLHINIKGIEIVNETNDFAEIQVNAGEVWHAFVLWTLENNFGGLENLSLIPGYVGASPIQNIGAYGIEIKDRMVSCQAIHVKTGEISTFTNEACKFGYRESIFKNELKGEYIITSVNFKLTKNNHTLSTHYGAIETQLLEDKIINPTIKDVSNAVIKIRQSKLPDPKVLGNSGSFFKNPIVPLEIYEKAKLEYPDMPHYPVNENFVKVPAGWLIEQAGFKGKKFGDAGIHEKQALVLVNHGNATGNEIWQVAQNIIQTIQFKYGISIEAEVNVV